MHNPIKAVIFDYAGVLSHHQPEPSIGRMESLTGVSGARFQQIYWGAREPYDRGALDGPAYWRDFGERAGRSFSDGEIRALIDADTESWIVMNDVMVQWILTLQRAGLRTAILSNMGVDLRAHVERHFEWVRRCDHRTFSCDVGMVKPEASIYRHSLEGVGVPVEELIFIDDRQVNIDAAEAVGLKGLLFDSPEGLAARIPAAWGLPSLDVGAALGRG